MPRRANSYGVRLSYGLCRLTWLQSCRHAPILFRASARDKNQFRFRHSALNLPLKDSLG